MDDDMDCGTDITGTYALSPKLYEFLCILLYDMDDDMDCGRDITGTYALSPKLFEPIAL